MTYSRRKYYCYHQNTKWLWRIPIIHFSNIPIAILDFSLLLLVKLLLLILFGISSLLLFDSSLSHQKFYRIFRALLNCDRAERNDIKSRLWLIFSPFLFPLKKIGKKDSNIGLSPFVIALNLLCFLVSVLCFFSWLLSL